jgi:hypothetical protein
VAGNKTVFRGGKRMNRIASALVAATVLLAASIVPAAAEVHGELSPTEAIPDLDKASCNEAGKVEYSSDIMLLMPADPSKGMAAAMHWPPAEKKK